MGRDARAEMAEQGGKTPHTVRAFRLSRTPATARPWRTPRVLRRQTQRLSTSALAQPARAWQSKTQCGSARKMTSTGQTSFAARAASCAALLCAALWTAPETPCAADDAARATSDTDAAAPDAALLAALAAVAAAFLATDAPLDTILCTASLDGTALEIVDATEDAAEESDFCTASADLPVRPVASSPLNALDCICLKSDDLSISV